MVDKPSSKMNFLSSAGETLKAYLSPKENVGDFGGSAVLSGIYAGCLGSIFGPWGGLVAGGCRVDGRVSCR